MARCGRPVVKRQNTGSSARDVDVLVGADIFASSLIAAF
jgi:hypothetical protein